MNRHQKDISTDADTKETSPRNRCWRQKDTNVARILAPERHRRSMVLAPERCQCGMAEAPKWCGLEKQIINKGRLQMAAP